MGIASTIKLYHRWWKAWGTLPVSAWVRAAALYRAGKFEEAISSYESGLARYSAHPAAISAHLDLAYCLFRAGRFDEALQTLKFIVGRTPLVREAHIRLATVQMWLGQAIEAAWTMKRALQLMRSDAELVGTFLAAVVENGGPRFLLNEAIEEAARLPENEVHPKLQVARARLKILQNEPGQGRTELEALAIDANATRDAVLAYAEVLVEDGKIAQARQHLRRLMNGASEHPRVLSLLAESYLKSGPFYNTEFAAQLATNACQKTNWCSPREMHVLAEAYLHDGDKISALLVASKAKEAGSKLLGAYREEKTLDKLIETLSTGTQA